MRVEHKSTTLLMWWSFATFALCLAAWLAFTWANAPSSTPAPSPTEEADILRTSPPPAASTAAQPPETTKEPNRELASDSSKASKSKPQGFTGRVIDDRSRAVPGITVYLLESASNDPLLIPRTQQQRHLLAPIASTQTDSEGVFHVGLEVAQDISYDIAVLSTSHAMMRLAGLHLLPKTWHDVGTLALKPGTTIHGRVSVAGQPDVPIPQTLITVTSGGAFADAAMRALLEDNGSLIAHTDSHGEFEIKHAPTNGIVRVAATAQGFARVVHQDIEVQPRAKTRVDFSLPIGRSLSGDVRTKTGLPIIKARVEAWPKAPGILPITTFTDDNGHFLIRGLLPKPHRVRISAEGFATEELTEVLFERPLQITMIPQHRLQVTVRTSTGRTLRRYRLGLRRFFPSDPKAPLDAAALLTGKIGSIHEIRDQRVRLDASTDYAEIRGIPGGIFTCEVQAEGFAKTLATPLRFLDTKVQAHPTTPSNRQPGSLQQVEVVVTQGCEIRGRVVDSYGNPLEKATVQTQPTGMIPDNPMMRMMQGLAPQMITKTSQLTDSNGLFRLGKLAWASYQLQIDHPDACRTFALEIDGTSRSIVDVQTISMKAGSMVTGTATVDGQAVGQMKVVLTTPTTSAANQSISLETVTDPEGRYRFARRIPPGRYELRAAIVGSTQPESDIFRQLVQLKRSATTLDVPLGIDIVNCDIDLPSKD